MLGLLWLNVYVIWQILIVVNGKNSNIIRQSGMECRVWEQLLQGTWQLRGEEGSYLPMG